MLKALWYLIISFIIIAFIPALFSYFYYQYRFLPHITRIDKVMDGTPRMYLQAPKRFRRFLVAAEGRNRIYGRVAKHLLRTLRVNHPRNWTWHGDRLAWRMLVKLHYGDEKVIALWCTIITMDGISGCDPISQARFNSGFPQLNEKQLATLAALAKSPDYYRQYPQRLESRVKNLMQLQAVP